MHYQSIVKNMHLKTKIHWHMIEQRKRLNQPTCLIIEWNQQKDTLKWRKRRRLTSINHLWIWSELTAQFSAGIWVRKFPEECGARREREPQKTHRDSKCDKQRRILKWFVVKIFAIKSKWKRSRREGERKSERRGLRLNQCSQLMIT